MIPLRNERHFKCSLSSTLNQVPQDLSNLLSWQSTVFFPCCWPLCDKLRNNSGDCGKLLDTAVENASFPFLHIALSLISLNWWKIFHVPIQSCACLVHTGLEHKRLFMDGSPVDDNVCKEKTQLWTLIRKRLRNGRPCPEVIHKLNHTQCIIILDKKILIDWDTLKRSEFIPRASHEIKWKVHRKIGWYFS